MKLNKTTLRDIIHEILLEVEAPATTAETETIVTEPADPTQEAMTQVKNALILMFKNSQVVDKIELIIKAGPVAIAQFLALMAAQMGITDKAELAKHMTQISTQQQNLGTADTAAAGLEERRRRTKKVIRRRK
jgi:hypothetical protein